MNILRTILFSMVVAMAGAVHDARAQAPNDGEELGAVSSGSAHLAKDDSLADGLYMLGTWVANYTAGYSSITITLPFIHNVGNFTSGTLRLSFWATVTAPARGAGFTGYRLATFPTMAPLGSGLSYQNISQSTSMLVPPDGTYWLVLVLEEYYPSACPSSADGYCLADSTVSFSQRTFGSTSPDVVVSQALLTNPVSAGKDAIVDVTVTNTGPGTATGVTLTMTYEAFTSAIWASPGCVKQPSTSYVCAIGTMGSGATSRLRLVLRRSGAGTLTNSATVTSTTPDANTANNTSNISATVFPGTAGVPVLRYRLYSPVTLEHHFTTDANEYNVLGASGGWVKEGTVGKVLNNPGSFNGVAAIPYYRLYNDYNHWHHWTTDANEYYTLVTFPGWNGEGVDGYILPTVASGSTQLFRLVYPNGTGLHHWTIDAHEYATLISHYGWVGEGGSGFVVQ